jgi:acyl-CoA synthetase (AMP-forming)/AMP-acid ligase II
VIRPDPSGSFLSPLQRRARADPDRPALVVLEEDGRQCEVTVGDLHRSALITARALADLGIQRDELVILVLRHSLELVHGFLGIAYLGAVPSIFPFLTPKLDPASWRQGVHRLVSEAQARAIVTSAEFAEDLRLLLPEDGCPVVEIESLLAAGGDAVSADRGVELEGGERTALLQFSSGTTGLQKGVSIPHRAVLNNIRARCQAFALRDDDVVVSWLPLYHDMGLISGLLLPLLTGIRSVLFSPFDWVRRPARLFQLIHEHRGTLCWMPNFALNHSVRSSRRSDLEGLDLSCWRLLVNGSELVREDSMRRFVRRFEPYGFAPDTMVAAYGLAENTVGVSASLPDRAPTIDWVSLHQLQRDGKAVPNPPGRADSTSIVSCGRPYPGTEISIADSRGCQLPARRVGEVLIRGDSLFSGYHRQPALTADSFTDGWFHTGDLGYLVDGNLHICGRIKDLMILAGRNIHPQDVEAIANEIDEIRPGRAVAFSVPDDRLGSEAIVIVCEPRRSLDAPARSGVEMQLRRELVRRLDIVPRTVAFVDSGWVIKTPSGKLARSANREKWLRS